MLRTVKKKLLELAHRAGYEIMRKAGVELAVMSLQEQPPISRDDVLDELERLGEDFVRSPNGRVLN